EHEWTVWQDLALPEDKVLVPGIVSHATNVVEHPELVAQRLLRFAQLVGPERVIGSTDCGLGGRVHPQIAWAKLESLVQGAQLASQRLCRTPVAAKCSPGGHTDVVRRTIARSIIGSVRILFVTESFLPHMTGVTGSVLRVADHFAATGDDLGIIAPARAGADDHL